MDSRLGAALLRLTGWGLIAVALVALVVPRAVNVGYHQVIVAVLAIAFVVLARTVHLSTWMTGRRPWVLAFLAGGVAAVVGLGLRYPYGWDARVVIEQAKLLHSGAGLRPEDYAYLSLYPNNFPLLAIDRWGVAIADSLGLAPDTVLTILSATCVAITSYAVHVLVRSVATASAAFGAQFLVLALVATSPWVIVPYTDIYAMPLVVGAMALGVVAMRRRGGRRVVLLVLAIGAAGVAFAIKTTPVVLAVAAGLTALILAGAPRPAIRTGPRRGDLRRDARGPRLARAGAAVLAGAVLFAVVGMGAGLAARSVSGVDESQLRPQGTTVLWWVAMAQDEVTSPSGVTSYGAYRRDLVTAIEGQPPEAINRFARDFIAERWDERGPVGTVEFYANKLAWNWGDGMFWAWGEGGDSLPGAVQPKSALARTLNQVNGFHGHFYTVRSDFAQALWLATLLVTGLGLLVARPRREVLFTALTVLGIAAFTVVFQGRSRYLFTFVPVVAALAGMVSHDFRALVSSRGRALWSKPPRKAEQSTAKSSMPSVDAVS